MTARSRDEEFRVSTPLELLFDLCFVVAIRQAGDRLVHAEAEGHLRHGLTGYAFVFFAIWWAWVNFTWFASAYDTDDVAYRVATLVQMSGVLVLAAGVPRAFDHNDFTTAVVGYLIMRVALTLQWLRAAHGEPGPIRRTALRYATGLALVQVGWLVMVLLPRSVWDWGFVALAICELSVPVIAERHQATSWHPQHISERYGLFTIIILGETISASTVAVQVALDEKDVLFDLLPIAGGGLLLVFAAYWIYFDVPIREHLSQDETPPFAWGYGHYFIFASGAAVGAGLEVAVDKVLGKTHVSELAAAAAVTVPIGVFLVSTWAVHARHDKRETAQWAVLPVSAVLVLACTFAGHWAVLLAGLVSVTMIACAVVLAARAAAASSPGPA
ncbi:low temperature requirement protein A [Streptomyces sp. TP-A0356]|uniref:low temperature requirement protein A n=1 Tax=Streptomyces sp. TP-A0356 TaxID=1359208 RepID=UPI000A3F243E